MNRAFVREPDGDTPPEQLADIPIPPLPNPVTARGLAHIEATAADLEHRLADAANVDPAEAARLRRLLRYWSSRRTTAHLTPPPDAKDEVGFGSRVTVEWPGRGQVSFDIVGEDESDPPAGRVSWRAPVAAALIGNGVGDVVKAVVGGRETGLTILGVDNHPRPVESEPKPSPK
jgi:transcription elongation GreA/GreB family factor